MNDAAAGVPHLLAQGIDIGAMKRRMCGSMELAGEGALLLAHPEAIENPFFLMAPDWALVPLVGLATMATVIASQALISGAFSVTKQVIQLGYLPRLQVLHTSVKDTGQIYIPFVNWGLFVAIVLAVVMFKSSSNLASAYGVSVTGSMLIDTILLIILASVVEPNFWWLLGLMLLFSWMSLVEPPMTKR